MKTTMVSDQELMDNSIDWNANAPLLASEFDPTLLGKPKLENPNGKAPVINPARK